VGKRGRADSRRLNVELTRTKKSGAVRPDRESGSVGEHAARQKRHRKGEKILRVGRKGRNAAVGGREAGRRLVIVKENVAAEHDRGILLDGRKKPLKGGLKVVGEASRIRQKKGYFAQQRDFLDGKKKADKSRIKRGKRRSDTVFDVFAEEESVRGDEERRKKSMALVPKKKPAIKAPISGEESRADRLNLRGPYTLQEVGPPNTNLLRSQKEATKRLGNQNAQPTVPRSSSSRTSWPNSQF